MLLSNIPTHTIESSADKYMGILPQQENEVYDQQPGPFAMG